MRFSWNKKSSCWRRLRHPSTVILSITIGIGTRFLSSLRTGDIGSYVAFTKISMTSRLRFWRLSPGKPVLLAKSEVFPTCPGPFNTSQTAFLHREGRAWMSIFDSSWGMSTEISRCPLVRKLLAPRPGDTDVTDNVRASTYSAATYVAQQGHPVVGNRESQMSHASSDSSPAPSRQGSRVDLSGNMRGNGSYPSILSPPPAQRAVGQPMRQPSLSNGHHLRTNSDLRPGQMARADSGLSATTTGSGNNSSFVKVKVHYQDDLIAIRLPQDIPFAQLQERLEQRLDTKLSCVQYRDESSGEYYDILSDHDLNTAMQRNPKLVLSVS